MMLEAQEIGEALGVSFAVDVDRRIAGAAEVGAHKTSMLQDLELGRPLEIDALVTAVQELGQLTGIKTFGIDVVLALDPAAGSPGGRLALIRSAQAKGSLGSGLYASPMGAGRSCSNSRSRRALAS